MCSEARKPERRIQGSPDTVRTSADIGPILGYGGFFTVTLEWARSARVHRANWRETQGFSKHVSPIPQRIHLRACLTWAILEKYTPKVDSTISTTGLQVNHPGLWLDVQHSSVEDTCLACTRPWAQLRATKKKFKSLHDFLPLLR